MIRVGAAAAMVDDQADVESLWFVGAFPGLSEEPRLGFGRERRGFSDEHVRDLQPQDRADRGVRDGIGRHDQQPDRTLDPLSQRDDVRQQPAFVGSRCRHAGAILDDIGIEKAGRHHHDVSIAWRVERGNHMRQQVRIAHRHQHVPGPRLDLMRRQLG